MQERGDFAGINGGHGVNFLLVPQKSEKEKQSPSKNSGRCPYFDVAVTRDGHHPWEGPCKTWCG
jgi:hypothetical protein